MRKGKRLLSVLALVVFFCLSIPQRAYADNGNTIVHITNTGACYHKAGCSYLKSDIEVTLSEAVDKGLRPCSRCNPPKYSGTSSSSSLRTSVYSSTSSSNDGSNSNNIGWAIGICAVVGAAAIYIKGSKDNSNKSVANNTTGLKTSQNADYEEVKRKLGQYKAMHDEGLISQEEYNLLKSKLLGL